MKKLWVAALCLLVSQAVWSRKFTVWKFRAKLSTLKEYIEKNTK